MSVEFKDNSAMVISQLEHALENFLIEACSEVEDATAKRTPVDTGQLKGSWAVQRVNKFEYYVGSPLEYAIWLEMGTGDYALNHDGRQGGWVYIDPKTGKRVFTKGTKPKRMLYSAYMEKKGAIIKRGQSLGADFK
ncbi:MAG: HK97 gp10 family phage protein [Turicibacter sp.]|nr:HK97 gp10 family phage protein [Turicibacter sp.]